VEVFKADEMTASCLKFRVLSIANERLIINHGEIMGA
jgi:hypothetical protein